MKIAVAGDSAGEGLARILADHLKQTHDVAEISHTADGPDAYYANLADRVGSAVIERRVRACDPCLRHGNRCVPVCQQDPGDTRCAMSRHLLRRKSCNIERCADYYHGCAGYRCGTGKRYR